MSDILSSVIDLPCHPKNRGEVRSTSAIRYLVYHYTSNDGDRAENNARYYRDNVVSASAHYFVDDEKIYRSVEDARTAWAVGGKKWADCQQTGGGTLYGMCTNSNSLSIEMCDTQRDGRIMATEATLERAAALGRALMEKYNIPIERVVRHFDVTGKHCPAYFMDTVAWEAFKGRLVKQEVGALCAPLQVDNTPDPWAAEAVNRAIAAGVLRGSDTGDLGLHSTVDKQSLAVILDRLGLLEARAADSRPYGRGE